MGHRLPDLLHACASEEVPGLVPDWNPHGLPDCSDCYGPDSGGHVGEVDAAAPSWSRLRLRS